MAGSSCSIKPVPPDVKLRVGVVGAGYLGKFHAEKYACMEGVTLVGVADIDASKAEAVAHSHQTAAYTDYHDLFGRVDAVSIVAPTPLHYTISKDFLSRQIDLLIEKPMTTTCTEADELIRIAEERGLIIQVGHLERFNPAVIALRDIVRAPMFIEARRLSVFKERCTDVSVVLDLMIHDIDIILNFVGSDLRDVRAAGIAIVSPHVDIANARLEFESGCVADITASRISMANQRKICLFQKNAYISVDFAGRELTVVEKNGAAAGPIPGMGVRRLSFPAGDALDDELKSFVHSVRTRQTPEVTAAMGRDALEIALRVMEQIQKNSSRSLIR